MNLNKRNRTHLAMVYSPGCVVNMVLFAFPVKLLQVIISECFVKKLYTWCKQPINLLFRAIHLLTKNKLIFSEQYILFVRNCENIISRQPNTIGIAYLSFSKKPPPLLCWFKFWVVNYRPVICMSWIYCLVNHTCHLHAYCSWTEYAYSNTQKYSRTFIFLLGKKLLKKVQICA